MTGVCAARTVHLAGRDYLWIIASGTPTFGKGQLVLQRQYETRKMSDTGFMLPGMNEPLNRYDVTVTVARDGDHLPEPAEFAVAAEQAASSRNASVMSAHMAEKMISIVTVNATDRLAAVAVALAVVSEALRRPVSSSSR